MCVCVCVCVCVRMHLCLLAKIISICHFQHFKLTYYVVGKCAKAFLYAGEYSNALDDTIYVYIHL